ncbi:hypothetical protein AVEN_197373-1 [Araneus ventricosus]|uniref:Integrase catalytic domain-containing protein n=1 Tax=Araneus ventricosus TaxID=182803 RepID=A0A4Y2K7L4_ARAVE|nr:hypothetical protein AVEN_197373-1 [Araneus ventricosus]
MANRTSAGVLRKFGEGCQSSGVVFTFQLRSSMIVEFTSMLGTRKIKTTPYHPISNGIVGRSHRHLKSIIKAQENDKWSELIPVILLGIRTAVKEDL